MVESRGAPAPGTQAPAPSVNLLVDLAGLTTLFERELESGPGLDAFLFAAGINQILEDHLHRDYLELGRVAPRLRTLPRPLDRASTVAVRAARRLGIALRRADPRERRLVALQRRWSVLVQLLAAAQVQGPGGADGDLRGLAAETLAGLRGLSPKLLRQFGRQPTSFRSLDQQPADLKAIVERFSDRHPDRGLPLLVVGVRTSGSYLAPMYAACLAQLGYRDVRVLTVRPKDDCLPWEVLEIQELVRVGGLLLVADDPPKTGAALSACLRRFERMGVLHGSIVLLLPLLDGADSLPPSLAAYSAITLAWTESAMRRRLSSPNLLATLQELLRGRTIQLSPPAGEKKRITVEAVLSARRLPLPPVTGFQVGSHQRRHARALIRVRLREAANGREFDHHVYAKGVGLGYFGDHSRAVAGALSEFFPEFYGLRHGLLFRCWLEDRHRVVGATRPGELDDLADRIGSYVRARHQRLGVGEDPAPRTGGVSLQVVKLMARSFGRVALPSRVLLRPWTRRLLRLNDASVIDGSMSPGQWFRVGARGSTAPLLKVDYDERAFSNQDTVVDELYSYDPVFDLAGAAADFAITSNQPSLESCFEDRLRLAYETGGGLKVPGERWLLYQLVHAASHIDFLQEALEVRQGFGGSDEGPVSTLEREAVARATDGSRRAMARFEQRYLAGLLLGDAGGEGEGPLCAIDIDGVLETAPLGYSSATPLGVRCLRALIRHGYRPVLASGRSLDEIRDRCVAYHLQGGVAEYGAVVYDHVHDRVIELLTDEQRLVLDGLRSALSHVRGVQIDAGYQRAIRASLEDASGARRPLPTQLANDVLRAEGLVDRVRLVRGYAQTDFATAEVDKAAGIQVLLRAAGRGREGDDEKPLAFAVGDTALDLPMLRLARMAFAPANADRHVREAGVDIVRGACQQGLAHAVGKLLGHRPGGCRVCAVPPLDGESELLFAVLSAQAAGRWGKLLHAGKLATLLMRGASR
jgi:hydroxymethylpyrimidine pyrophosphatase-like HAD family hydrolase